MVAFRVAIFDMVVCMLTTLFVSSNGPAILENYPLPVLGHACQHSYVHASMAQMARHATIGVLAGDLQAAVHRLMALTRASKEHTGDDFGLGRGISVEYQVCTKGKTSRLVLATPSIVSMSYRIVSFH